MTEDEIIDQIIHSFSNYNLRDIQEINKSQLDFTVAEFILCSCFIDQLSGFRYNIEKVGKRYRLFVTEYLPAYNSKELYEDLRNKLVHNYSIGKYYALLRNEPNWHLFEESGVKYLNLENFITDLNSALSKYILELKNNATIRNNALKWFSKYRIITLKS